MGGQRPRLSSHRAARGQPGDLGAARASSLTPGGGLTRCQTDYVWVAAYVGLAQLETAARQDPCLVALEQATAGWAEMTSPD
jgi:hypothetical protein